MKYPQSHIMSETQEPTEDLPAAKVGITLATKLNSIELHIHECILDKY